MNSPSRRGRRTARVLRNTACVVAALLLPAMFPAVAKADNPIIQTIYTADPAPLVHNGRVYLYTGHDEDASTWFTMKEWRVWSSADMVNWTDHGSPLNIASFSWAKQDAWAGQAIQRNGKFYWYVPMVVRATGAMGIGVAVADSPTGPFRDAIGRPLVSNGQIDPTVMIDTDGQAYLYWGNPDLWYVKLNADMISTSTSPTKIPLTTAGYGTRTGTGSAERPTLFEEGPYVYKRNNLYYNVFAAKCCSEFIGYSTSTGPLGPWTYRGTVMPTQGSSFTNHPGVVDFNGGSYFFYHNGALPGGGGFTRSVAVEKFTYGSDGSIPQMSMTTAGAPQIGTLNPYVRQEAETIAYESGVETEVASEGGMAVSFIDNGDWIKVKGVGFGSGASTFSARVASGASGGTIELRLGGTSGTVVGRCTVPATGGWTTWTTVSCPVSGATGTQDLYLRFTGGSGSLFNLNWWQFGGSGPTTTTTTTVPPTTTTTTTTRPTTTTTTTVPTTTTTTGGNGTPGAGALVTPSGKCLDVSGTGNGSSARIATCNGGSGQSWSFRSDGSLRTLGGSMCMDASGRGTANGTALIIYSCNGQSNQQFAQGSNGSIVNAGSGRCVDVPNGSTTDGTAVQLYDCWGGDPQKWTLQGGGDPTSTTTTTQQQPTTTTTTTQQQPTTTTTTTQQQPTTTTSGGNGGAACSATYTTVGSWGGGFQGEVKVSNTGGNVTSWTVTLNLNSGQSITSLWSGVASGSTGTVRVANAAYNGALGSGATTSFGFTAGGSATPVPSVTCSAG